MHTSLCGLPAGAVIVDDGTSLYFLVTLLLILVTLLLRGPTLRQGQCEPWGGVIGLAGLNHIATL